MDDSELASIKDGAELGAIASMDLAELDPKIKDLAKAVRRLHVVTTDLVGRLPEEAAAVYSDDLNDIDHLLRFAP